VGGHGGWNATTASLALPAGRARSLQIAYTATSMVDPEKVRFRYQLIGYDAKWQDAAGRRIARYTNLRPGKYTFRVTACNNHGYWNETGASFAFSLAPYFYQTWTFYVASALLLGAAAFAVHQRRLRIAHNIQELQASIRLSDERARIAKDMHDDIGANLTRIALLNEVARNSLDPERIRTELTKVAAIAGETIGSLSELVWATNSNYDTLENTVVYLREYVARYFEPTGTTPSLRFPATVPDLRLNFTFRRHLLLIIKETLHNIVKHAKASQAFVDVEVRAHELRLCIRDNGRGIDGHEHHASATGLQSIRHRVTALNGTLRICSKPGDGTCIEIVLPLPGKS
jgi:signal transduction histidine kinase